MIRSRVLGIGHYLPEKILTNADIEELCDTTDEWIQQRTGIKQRHAVAPGQGTSDIATHGALKALDDAGIGPLDLDLIILCTTTPDQILPASACTLQAAIGAKKAAAFDLNAACSGFVYGVSTADAFIRSGMYKTILVSGVDVASNRLSWRRRDTAVLFGDGGGAIVLRAEEGDRGVLTSHLWADGRGRDMLWYPGGGSRIPTTHDNIDDDDTHTIQMKGQDLFKRAVIEFTVAIRTALEACELTIDDLDLFVPHQANARIILAATERLGLPKEKVALNIDRVGNCTAGSIPIALDEAVRDGRVTEGSMVLLAAFGAGLTWASAIIRW